MIFTEEQERAITAIVEWYGEPGRQEMYLAGYAGTGKSTVCAEAIERLKDKYFIDNVATGAYTGKAAFVLRKKGNANASTIHSMIYKPVEDPETKMITFVLNPLGPAAQAELIVLDECSMINIEMANDLRSFGKKILVMGDPGQLPPINGEGSFTAREPDFFLREIHRQAADSPIIYLATLARQGMSLPMGFKADGVEVLPLTNATAEAMHNPNTQMLCGLNRVRWSVTQIMRKELGFSGPLPIVGERVMCCKNNKEYGLFNGGMGTLTKLEIKSGYDAAKEQSTVDAYRMNVRMEDSNFEKKKLLVDPFLFNQHFDNGASVRNRNKKPNEFDWSYCISVHKAQGSQWPHVTMINDAKSFRDNAHRWMYTAITRAESGLIILGN